MVQFHDELPSCPENILFRVEYADYSLSSNQLGPHKFNFNPNLKQIMLILSLPIVISFINNLYSYSIILYG